MEGGQGGDGDMYICVCRGTRELIYGSYYCDVIKLIFKKNTLLQGSYKELEKLSYTLFV